MAQPQRQEPLAAALGWVSVVMAFGLEVLLPTWAGDWLDGHWHTGVLCTLIGLGIGFTVGLVHLLQAVQSKTGKPR